MHFQPLYKQKVKGSAAFIAPYRLQSLEGCNKVQVPKLSRWQFKLEPDQVLRVGIGGLGGGHEFFMQGWVRMDAFSFQRRSYSRLMVKKKI